MPTENKYTAFLSHSSKDAKEVSIIRDYLETNGGFTCFMSGRDLEHSSEWQRQLVDAMDSSSVLIYIHSKSSNTSEEVGREINYFADKCRRPILVYRLSDDDYAKDRSYYLQSINYIDSLLSCRDGLPALVTDVSNALTRMDVSGSRQEVSTLILFLHKLRIPIIVVAVLAALALVWSAIQKADKVREVEAFDAQKALCLGWLSRAEGYLQSEDSLQLVLPCLDSAQAVYNTLKSIEDESLKVDFSIEGKQTQYLESMEGILDGCINAVKSVYPTLKLFSAEDALVAKEQLKSDIAKIELLSSILGKPVDSEIEIINNTIQ